MSKSYNKLFFKALLKDSNIDWTTLGMIFLAWTSISGLQSEDETDTE